MDAQVRPGFSKGNEYDKHRATYSDDAVEKLLQSLQVSGKRNARVLDLAAGTGKFTEALARRPEQFDVLAVEPLDNLREILAQKNLPGVTIAAGEASRIPAEDATIDAVVVAQAFHWFANLEALRDLHRVLQRQGALGMIWNVEEWNSPRGHKATTAWENTTRELLFSLKSDEDSPRYRDMQWRTVFDEQVKKTPLSLLVAGDDQLFALPLAETKLDWTIKLSKEAAWDRFATLSQVAVLEGVEKERVRTTFMEATAAAELDADGLLEVHGYTHIAWASKIPKEGRASLTGTDIEAPRVE